MLRIDAEKRNIPKVVLVGRPNVGKSTFFNALVKKRVALVADKPGVTRDRRAMVISPPFMPGKEICLIDTGGWVPKSFQEEAESLLPSLEEQVVFALKESAIVLHVVDVLSGLTALDKEISVLLHKGEKKFFTICNKCDSHKQENLESEFYSLGGEKLFPVSAEHRLGLAPLWEAMEEALIEGEAWKHVVEKKEDLPLIAQGTGEKDAKEKETGVQICVVGRPNVGKSSFLNCLLEMRRLVAHFRPGTTTDSVHIEVKRGEKAITLVDTPGMRRHAKQENNLERLAVMQAGREIDKAELSFLLLDGRDGVTAQDIRIGKLLEQGACATIVVVNKWDLAPGDMRMDSKESLDSFVRYFRKKMPFLNYAPVISFSAKKRKLYAAKMGMGVRGSTPEHLDFSISGLWSVVNKVLENRKLKISTGELNRVLQKSFSNAPSISQSSAKLYFAHQISSSTPTFCAYVKRPKSVPDSYKRYLVRNIRESFGFSGSPIRWIFKEKSSK